MREIERLDQVRRSADPEPAATDKGFFTWASLHGLLLLLRFLPPAPCLVPPRKAPSSPLSLSNLGGSVAGISRHGYCG